MEYSYELRPEAYMRLREKYPKLVMLHREIESKFHIYMTPGQFGNVFYKNIKKVSLHYAMAIAACLGEQVEDILVPPEHVWVNKHLPTDGAETKESTPLLDTEGRPVPRFSTVFERKPKLRREAIREHGLTCMGCDFNFERWYGPHGRGYIEVHHVKPLSTGEQQVNPKDDLIVLCANCHAMVHADSRHVLGLEELRSILSQAENSASRRR